MDSFIAKVNEKFFESGDSDPKGLQQLFNLVNLISQKIWLGKNDDLEDAKHIYPVITTYDNKLGEGIVSNYLAKEFQALFGVKSDKCEKKDKYGDLVINNLIILSIDDLELLEFTLEKTSFLDLLKDYSSTYPERNNSFYNYIVSSKYSGKLQRNQRLTELSRCVLAEVMKFLEKQ